MMVLSSSKKSILVLGADGYIGSRICGETGFEGSADRISSLNDVEGILERYKPSTVINCIARTGWGEKGVDRCEDDAGATILANSTVPVLLTEAAIRHGFRLVHISTGYVYETPENNLLISEEKTPDFFEVFYSRTKIYSESALVACSGKHPILILRPNIVLDDRPHPRNILDKLIKSGRVVGGQHSVTYLPDFIEALQHLIKVEASGLYNVVNKGGLKYSELLDEYRAHNPSFDYEAIDLKDLGRNRPNAMLSTEKLEKTGFKVRDIHSVIGECLKGYIGDVGMPI